MEAFENKVLQKAESDPEEVADQKLEELLDDPDN
jgi:hypothetical protein